MRIDRTRCLFGGTLLAAGLTAGAEAQFAIDLSYARTFATEYAFFNSDADGHSGTGPFAIQALAATDVSSAYSVVSADAMQIRTAASVNNGSAFANDYYTWFGVLNDTMATLDWDWTQAYGFVRIDDITNGGVLFGEAGSTSGSIQIPLLADTFYTIRGYSAARSEGPSSTRWTLTIPSPGTGAALGLAGFAVRRRRR